MLSAKVMDAIRLLNQLKKYPVFGAEEVADILECKKKICKFSFEQAL